MSLSDRIRENSEAAPWVVTEIKRMEAQMRVAINRFNLIIESCEEEGADSGNCSEVIDMAREGLAILKGIEL